MSDPPTSLSLPANLPWPVQIARVLVRPGSRVDRGYTLLEYKFTASSTSRELSRRQREADGLRAKGEAPKVYSDGLRQWDMVGTWQSPLEGEVTEVESWVVPGERLEERHSGRTALQVQQPCSHPVQLHGMCGICGKDLNADDYLAPPLGLDGTASGEHASSSAAGPSRYPGGYEMGHDSSGVTVNQNEAKRLDEQTRLTLLAARRLSLIVDLDQTIIHTTVDPTVGEWMAELRSVLPLSDDPESTTPPGSPKGKVKDPNQNAVALQDVAQFQIPDDVPDGYVPHRDGYVPHRGARQEGPQRWYYTKPRPGLTHFLESMSEIYEMHVYTMGTRAYAEAICAVVDPEQKYFGGRILSRDDSRNFTSKNLKRLFPTDTSMVVVIDDRADVWGDCPNLVKVVPYDFFLGIGDINSSFLPPTTNHRTTPLADPASPDPSDASTPPLSTPEPVLEEGLIAQKKLLDEVSEARPLAKLQQELEDHPVTQQTDDTTPMDAPLADAIVSAKSEVPSHHLIPSKPLLNPYDGELHRVAQILREAHSMFYAAYDSRLSDQDVPIGCDMELVIPEIKARVLDGCQLVFSGIIPRHITSESSEIWTMAEAFGAIPTHALTPQTTHLITATLGTEKTYRAQKLPNCKVVWAAWFWNSVALWERQPESVYLAYPPSKPATPVDTPVASRPDSPKAIPNGLTNRGHENTEDEDEDEMEQEGVGLGDGWDDDALKELEAFAAGDDGTESEYGLGSSQIEGSPSPRSRESTPGTPGTPRKRVRYADEEHLPLETFKDPSPNDVPSPPRKRKALLLGPAEPGDVPEANRFKLKTSRVGKLDLEPAMEDEADTGVSEADGDGDEDGEDEFAQMLANSLAD